MNYQKGHENLIPECTGAKEGLLLTFRRRYRKKRIPMTITAMAPLKTPPIVPPIILILELGDVDAEGSGVEVVVGRPRDERGANLERIFVRFERLVDATREVLVNCAKEGLGIGE